MSGTSVLPGNGIMPINPGSDWKVSATGDFNADGKNDIVLQNASGQAAIWFMNGASVLSGSGNAGVNPGPAWHILAGTAA